MGKRGPQPKPTNVRLLHGDRQDRVNDAEPQPSAVDVSPPDWMPESACEVWHRLAPDLQRKGVLTGWDVEAFASWCDAVVRRRSASRRIEDEGAVIEMPVYNRHGELTGHRVARNPWSLELKDADAQVQRWGARFGLTPSERAQLSVGEDNRGSSDDLLTG